MCVEVITDTFLYAVVTVDVLMANSNDVNLAKTRYIITKVKHGLWSVSSPSTIYPWVHAKKLRGKIEANSANVLSCRLNAPMKCTSEKWKYSIVVFKKKVKRSSNKFPLDEFITVFFAASIGRRKTEWTNFSEDFEARDLRHILCAFIAEKACFEIEIYQLPVLLTF